MKNEKVKIIIGAFIIGMIFMVGFGFLKEIPVQFSQNTNINQNVAQTYESISGIDIEPRGGNTRLSQLLNTLFQWGIAVAILLSVLFIVLGAIQYMTTDAVYGKEEGKGKITSAVAGLILALTSYLILNTINPELTKIKIEIKDELNVDSESLGDGPQKNK